MEDNDPQQHLKKRARRRLVGAVAFASVVAVVLPTIMDQEPRQPVQDVEIRIPGQDEKPFAPKFAQAPVDSLAPVEAPRPAARPPEPEVAAPVAAVPPAAAPSARLVESVPGKGEPGAVPAKVAEKPADKLPAEVKPGKPGEKLAEKAADKAMEKPAEKPAAKPDEGKRAAAILAGQFGEPAAAPAAAKGGEHLVLIGAFANEGNVKVLKSKLGELNIKTYTEPLDTPQGRKIRLRAGPFPNRDAAEKALEKMRRIGVSGVVAPR